MREPVVKGNIAIIPLTQGKNAIIDTCNLELVEGVNWYYLSYANTGYAGTRITEGGKKRLIRMHRYIMDAPEDKEVDHINGDGLDNRMENLRLVSRLQNQRNSRTRKDNKSGFKGVSFHAKAGKWQARIRTEGKQISLGLHETKEQAYRAYCEASEKYHGEYGRA